MASKVLSPKSWTDAIKGSEIDGDDFEKALSKHESLVKKNGKPEELLKSIDSIGKLADELKGDVGSVPKAKKYLAEVTSALKDEKKAIASSGGAMTITAIFVNESNYDDILFSVEDLNVAKDKKERWPVNQERLNKKSDMDVALVADGDGYGLVKWYGQDPNSPNSGTKEETVKYVKDGQKIKVSR
jgi:hypothetical protein